MSNSIVIYPKSASRDIVYDFVQLTVGTSTRLLLNVTRDFDSTRHVFLCRLLSNGSPVYNRAITLKLNSASYTSQQYPSLRTNALGYAWIALYLSPQANNEPVSYNVVAGFDGDPTSVAKASMALPNGTMINVCTTIQYNMYKPSTNSTTIIVRPQTTEGATTLMDTAAMQADAQTKGLQVWGPDSWSILPPFFKLHAKVGIGSLDMNVHSWLGLFACGVDSMDGVGRLLLKGFEGVSETDVITSAVISAMTATTAMFILSLIAASLNSWNLGLGLILAIYLIGGISMLIGFYLWPDRYASRALLIGVGATLLSLLIGAYTANALVKSLPYFIATEVSGADPVSVAVRSLGNSIVNYLLGATSAACYVVFCVNPVMVLFAVATAILAVLAICLALAR